MTARPILYTVGHSNHAIEKFLDLIEIYDVSKIVDVRSRPVSRWAPHFNRGRLETTLTREDIDYIWLGDILGGDCNIGDNHREYFVTLRDNWSHHGHPAIMCAEHNPFKCHRALVLAPIAVSCGWRVFHILRDGTTITL